ncbi:MAG: RdgB/HAM1 family non-canonical purine NTP pyrophosphatase [Candidatus Latescibacteria bacterium]|nr:RdgB/HAM1 family non-canonical purine NTP pyrophosphatase [Candidatus Latescibacterota bacterium]
MKFVAATQNLGKFSEIAAILSNTVEVISLTVPVCTDEDGHTFLENAVKKARAVVMATGLPAIADDSGLEVDALDGAPGVYSARFAGEGASDAERIAKLLGLMHGIPDPQRTARFRCVVAIVFPTGRVITAEGICEGCIAHQPRGENGFGYDPVFVVPELGGRTFAELDPEVKNRISHRARALETLKKEVASSLLFSLPPCR